MTNPEVRPRIKRIIKGLTTLRRVIARQFRETPLELEQTEYIDTSPTPPGPAKFRRGPSFD
jgi:hypothetical protein